MKKKDSFDFLRKANLMESHKQFMRLCQESYLPIDMVEEEDDEQQPQDNTPTDDMPPVPEQGQDMAPQDDNSDMPPMDDNEPDMDGDLPPMDDNDDDLGDLPPLTDDEIGGEDEEVIDVEDITDAQEKLNKKQNMLGKDMTDNFGQVDTRIEKLLQSIESLKGMIDKNNTDIVSLKGEISRRMPTDKQRLEMRSLDGYPFTQSPEDYWEKKEKEGNYEATDKKKEYTITNKDIDDFTPGEIERSLDSKNMRVTMDDIFRGF